MTVSSSKLEQDVRFLISDQAHTLNLNFSGYLKFSHITDKVRIFFSDLQLSVRTATSVFVCARRPCGRSGSRHAQNGFQLKMRLLRLDKRFWREVSTKANNELEGPKKKNEMHLILYYLTCSAKFMYFFTYKCSLE